MFWINKIDGHEEFYSLSNILEKNHYLLRIRILINLKTHTRRFMTKVLNIKQQIKQLMYHYMVQP